MNFKQQPVVIVKDDQKNSIRISKNNPEYAHVRLTQERSWLDPNGWFKKRTVSCLIHGKTDQIKSSGIGRMKKLPGIIYIKEQLVPFSENNPERDLKYAGNTGVVCKGVDPETGEIVNIYRKHFYDASGEREDILIAHVNSDEIRKANRQDSASINEMVETAIANHEESQEQVNPNQRDLFEAIEEAKAEEIEKAEEAALDPDEDETDELTVEDSTEEVEVEVDEEVEVLEEEEVENNPFSL